LPRHRRQRHDARAAGDEQRRLGLVAVPDEVAADRAPNLEDVAVSNLVHQVRGDLAVLEPLDRDRQRLAGGGGDRVRALGLVAVLGGQAHVEVLARAVIAPAVDVEHERAHPGRLLFERRNLCGEPGQSPQYRCSSHGSPYRW
jgi:hypothetical protein